MKQQWNSNETAMKQHETAQWNTMKQHERKINIKNRYLCGHRPWFKVFYWHKTVCFMTMKHCFILIQGVSWPCFILIQHVSRCFTTKKQIVSLLIHPDSTCFITVSSLWIILFHADATCFITVSPMGTSLKAADSCWDWTLSVNLFLLLVLEIVFI